MIEKKYTIHHNEIYCNNEKLSIEEICDALNLSETRQESLSDILHQRNAKNDAEYPAFNDIFDEIFNASLCIQYEICKTAEQTDDIHLKILSEGFNNIITKNHEKYLKIKNKIGETLQ